MTSSTRWGFLLTQVGPLPLDLRHGRGAPWVLPFPCCVATSTDAKTTNKRTNQSTGKEISQPTKPTDKPSPYKQTPQTDKPDKKTNQQRTREWRTQSQRRKGSLRRKPQERRDNKKEIQSDLGANGRVGCSKQRYQPKEVISLSNHCNHSKKHNSNHLSVHQWICSAIHASNQRISPIASYP